MFDDLIHYEYIDDLCSIDFKDEKLLQLFSIYISSNRDFKYNATYLTDSIVNFKKIIETFRDKKEKTIKFSKNLSKQYATPCNWIIILDDVFLIDNYFRFSTLTTFAKNYNSPNGANTSQVPEEIIKYHLKQFNLFSLKPKKIKVIYYNLMDERNYSHMDELSNKLKLSKLVESDYIKLSIEEE